MKNQSVLIEARRLYDLGFAIHWLRPRSKIPVESGWTTGPRKSWKELVRSYRPGMNVGVRLGTPSYLKHPAMGSGGYLAVIDIDVKSKDPRHKEEALTAARSLIKDRKPPVVMSGRGNGSRHYYCVTEQPFKTFNSAVSPEKVKVSMPSKKPSRVERELLTEKELQSGLRIANAWEVSLYSDGRQVVLPPSIHPDSGQGYRWGREIQDIPQVPRLHVKTLQAVRCDVEGNTGDDGEEAGSAREASTPPERSEGATQKELQGFRVEPVELEWLPISDDVRRAIIDGTGVSDRSGYLLKASSALLSAGLSQNEVLTVLTDPETYLGACSYEHAGETKSRRRAAEWVYRYTFKKIAKERSGEGIFGLASEAPPARKLSEKEMADQAREFAEATNWRQELDRNEKGKTRTTLKNLDLIFTHGVRGNVFIEDLFASRIEYGVDTPWGGKAKSYIQDIDMIRVKRWLADTEFGIEPNTAAILEATSLVADRCQIHPVREWLGGLKWDGVRRINTWIRDFCRGVAPEPYLSEISRKFLLAMVKRIFEPGCQWDYVLVLEGKQGKYKSSIARALAGDRWFMDNLPDLKDKDSMLNLQGKWLIELGELADVKRADYNLVKAYLVRRTDTVRPHYGRLKADVPRQSVFIGTINEGQYLKDPTGNRRYWPVKVGLCDVKALTAVRDQLFAEAMHLYRNKNEVLMLGPAATVQATEAQEERRVDDDESEMKDAFLSFRQSRAAKEFDFSKFKVRDLMVGVNAPWGAWNGKGYVLNIAAHILSSLGFERYKSHGSRYWRPIENRGESSLGVIPFEASDDPIGDFF